MKVEGVVVSYTLVNNLVETIIVRDGSGYDCRIFIDGYITKDIAIENLAEGHEIAVVGLSSYDNSFDGDASRIRVPDRSGIVCGTETVPIPPVYTPSTGGSTGGGAISAGAVKEGADKVTVAIPSAGAVLSQAAEDKLISLNEMCIRDRSSTSPSRTMNSPFRQMRSRAPRHSSMAESSSPLMCSNSRVPTRARYWSLISLTPPPSYRKQRFAASKMCIRDSA